VDTPTSRLRDVNQLLIDHPWVAAYRFSRQRTTKNSIYIRVHLSFLDGSMLYFTEYGEVDIGGTLQTVTYTYQWMTAANRLLLRWDNAPHYPHLAGFPHHLHAGDDKNIVSSEPMTLVKVLDVITAKLVAASRSTQDPQV
jgi:hypothetical protein